MHKFGYLRNQRKESSIETTENGDYNFRNKKLCNVGLAADRNDAVNLYTLNDLESQLLASVKHLNEYCTNSIQEQKVLQANSMIEQLARFNFIWYPIVINLEKFEGHLEFGLNNMAEAKIVGELRK